jgi:phosphoribosylanthranilate isomerase
LTPNLIQVAGVLDLDEAGMLLEEGVHQIGFPLRLAVHKEDLTEEEAAGIIRALPSPSPALLITYLTDAREILALCGKLGVRKVQVHAPLSVLDAGMLRESAPRFFLIKSLVVGQDNLLELERSGEELSPYVDAFITDTFDPATGACGATGKTHDWEVSRRLVELSPRPVILAGGLNLGNVRRAILHVRPAGVDVHTGVEGPDGRKDRRLVRAFVSEAAEGFAEVERMRLGGKWKASMPGQF